VDLADLESRMAALDTAYRPVAKAPVDLAELADTERMGERIGAALHALGVDEEAQDVLRGVIDGYGGGNEGVREAIRRLFDRYPSFRWAAHLPREWETAAGFRDRLILMSAHDQGADTRDEILALQDLCEQARRNGIDTGPILDEVAAMSSTVNRYGMGSMRDVLVAYGKR
jgi:hypothetical protein